VNDADTQPGGKLAIVRDNRVHSMSPLLMRSYGRQLAWANNRYEYAGRDKPSWDWNGKTWHSLEELQAAGAETGSTLRPLQFAPQQIVGQPRTTASDFDSQLLMNQVGLDGQHISPLSPTRFRLITTLDLQLDADGLIAPDLMSRLSVLRILAREYNPQQLQIVVLVPNRETGSALRNTLLDFDAPSILFVRAPNSGQTIPTSLVDSHDRIVAQWPASTTEFNPATAGYAVRQQLGAPIYAQMDSRP
jgi:hypothetical protein